MPYTSQIGRILRIGLLTGLLLVNSQGRDACQPNRSPGRMLVTNAIYSRSYQPQLPGPGNAHRGECKKCLTQSKAVLRQVMKRRQGTVVVHCKGALYPRLFQAFSSVLPFSMGALSHLRIGYDDRKPICESDVLSRFAGFLVEDALWRSAVCRFCLVGRSVRLTLGDTC